MTERCQNKFTQKLENQNLIIYVIIICSSLTVLYFYRLHVTTIVFSYGLGCLACYYGLNSSFLLNYISQLKNNFLSQTTEQEVVDTSIEEGCLTCGSKGCMRHDSRLMSEPWAGLQIHKQLDQAIEDFYNTILEQFINSWYSKITLQPFFVDELRNQLRYASAKLLKRALKVNYSQVITTRLVPCAMRHYCACTRDSCPPSPFLPMSPDSPPSPRLPPGVTPHPAACSRHHELQYLRCLTNAIMPYLVREQDQQNAVFRVLIREIFAGWVLLSVTDVLADPYILNTLIILATGDETMAQLPTTPNYKVEFLENFVRQTDSVYIQRSNLLNIDLEQVINDQDYFYSFMQYLKTTNHIHLLQFYKDIKSFQIRLLNPDLSTAEQASLQREGRSLYTAYVRNDTVPLPERDREELAALMDTDTVCINKLQTSRALYQAARQTHAILEKILLPRFLHSEEFYNILIGSRIPTGYQKQMNKKPQDRLMNAALRIGNRLKGALKPTTIDGHVLDSCDGSDTDNDSDNIDILKYLDSIASDEEDLSTYKVVLTDVEIVACGRGSVRVFTVCVHGVGGNAGAGGGAGGGAGVAGGGAEGGARLWAVRRSEHDFHLLRCKLHEFHQALNGLPLPSRRDNGPLENLRYKYEDFLQRLLRMDLLQNSELLHLFLTVDGDFSLAVQASTMSGATTTDLANIYQNVAHRLRKEKGQHLESFLRNLLVSSDMERYQALKQGTTKDVEEAQEMSEDIEVEVVQRRQRQARDIRNSVFNDNLGVEPNVFEITASKYQDVVVGFTQCFVYLLSKVIRARNIVLAVIGTLLSLNRSFVDEMFDSFLNKTLASLLSERRLAHLIRLGHGLLFSKKGTTPRNDASVQRERARTQLLKCIPTSATHVVGGGLQTAAATAFDIIQKPHLNKQLVYNLLDLCVAELFPELCEMDTKMEPKR